MGNKAFLAHALMHFSGRVQADWTYYVFSACCGLSAQYDVKLSFMLKSVCLPGDTTKGVYKMSDQEDLS